MTALNALKMLLEVCESLSSTTNLNRTCYSVLRYFRSLATSICYYFHKPSNVAKVLFRAQKVALAIGVGFESSANGPQNENVCCKIIFWHLQPKTF